MVDVLRVPKGAFGYVPTPALVGPLEFNLSRANYLSMGGHMDQIVTLEKTLQRGGEHPTSAELRSWPQKGGI